MTPDQRLLAIAALVSNSLYLTGVFVASAFVQHGQAWQLAGISYTMQIAPQISRAANVVASLGTWVFGIVAGAMIILGV